MVLLRRVIGDALRARRQGQHRTLREVSSAANVSLGYLSEIERGQKEASSELLAAICDALGAPPVRAAARGQRHRRARRAACRSWCRCRPSRLRRSRHRDRPVRQVATDGKVSVEVRQETPLKTTLRATRRVAGEPHRDVVCAA